MPPIRDAGLLKTILDDFDALHGFRRRLQDERLSRTHGAKLRLEWRRKLSALARSIKQVDADGPLGSLLKKYRLNKFHVVILLALLKRRLSHDGGSLKGRELLGLVADSSFEMLQAIAMLDPAAPLLASGAVVPEATATDDGDDILDSGFCLSERAFRLIVGTLKQRERETHPLLTKEHPYRSNLAYLMDLRRLCLLYQKRAAKVFNFDYWDHLGIGISESVSALNKQIARYSDKIRASLHKTPEPEKLALVAFQIEYSLELEELLIMVTLLFQELLEGNSYLDAVDLLKLVSRSEEDLVRRRKLFSARSPLIRQGLVLLEEMVQEKPLTAEVSMPAWVGEKLLTGGQHGKIDADSKIQFHKYLDRLDSSQTFFEDLESQN